MISRVGQGRLAEEMACQYLLQRGLVLRARNFRGPRGELDLIMDDGEHLVFVEVRGRAGDEFGHALETVDRYKQQRICATASRYLQANNLVYERYCRFDVVAVTNTVPPEFIWIKDAFYSTFS